MTEAEREQLRALADGREAINTLWSNERLATIAKRLRKKAAEQIHKEESLRLRQPIHKRTALQVVRDTFLDAAAQVVGFIKPRSEEDADFWFAGYCNWLLDDKGQPDRELMRAADELDTPGFRKDVLEKLWGECPDEAREIGLGEPRGHEAAVGPPGDETKSRQQPVNSGTTEALDAESIAILRVLAAEPRCLFHYAELKVATKGKSSDRTNRDRIPKLKRQGLVHHPKGERMGVTIASAGTQLLAFLDQRGAR